MSAESETQRRQQYLCNRDLSHIELTQRLTDRKERPEDSGHCSDTSRKILFVEDRKNLLAIYLKLEISGFYYTQICLWRHNRGERSWKKTVQQKDTLVENQVSSRAEVLCSPGFSKHSLLKPKSILKDREKIMLSHFGGERIYRLGIFLFSEFTHLLLVLYQSIKGNTVLNFLPDLQN